MFFTNQPLIKENNDLKKKFKVISDLDSIIFKVNLKEKK